mmetsp:Transcript_23141/g.64348  ORF Transcript_23141/g.64348 Transcript_23141/m.64348 type:complete len:86 (-) Transcript_23141:640-897(-)
MLSSIPLRPSCEEDVESIVSVINLTNEFVSSGARRQTDATVLAPYNQTANEDIGARNEDDKAINIMAMPVNKSIANADRSSKAAK